MPILWEPTSEVDGTPVRGVRVGAQDWSDAGVWRHEIRRRGVEIGNHARREARQTQGGAMTKHQSDEGLDGGVVVWVVGLACLALVLGLVLGALVLAGVL